MRMRHIVICGLQGYTVFFHIIQNRYNFRNLLNIKCIF